MGKLLAMASSPPVNPLRKFLEAREIPAGVFAEQCGLSASYFSRLLSGDREADSSLLAVFEAETNGAVTPNEWVRWWIATTEDAA